MVENMQYMNTTIAIDGPAASGKTTVGRMLGEKLGYLVVDTGSMYRAVTLSTLLQNKDPQDETTVTAIAESIDIQMFPVLSTEHGRLVTIIVDGVDVTEHLRTRDVDQNVSYVSAYKRVREEMVARQRIIGEAGKVVMIGRDIGTVVLPDAPMKIYMTASAETRAQRRYDERKTKDTSIDLKKILADIIWRDDFDSKRKHSPLLPAEDAIVLDTSEFSPEEVTEKIINLLHNT